MLRRKAEAAEAILAVEPRGDEAGWRMLSLRD
jgi:hypothetical protein